MDGATDDWDCSVIPLSDVFLVEWCSDGLIIVEDDNRSCKSRLAFFCLLKVDASLAVLVSTDSKSGDADACKKQTRIRVKSRERTQSVVEASQRILASEVAAAADLRPTRRRRRRWLAEEFLEHLDSYLRC